MPLKMEITKLLANQVSGGVRWKKASSIETAYKELATSESSGLASLGVFDTDGTVLVS